MLVFTLFFTNFFDAVSRADYAGTAEPDLLMPRAGAHPTGQMALMGLRWCVVSESNEDRRMDEAVRHHNPDISVADCTDREALVRLRAELARLCERALATFLVEPNEALGRVKQLLYLAADLQGGERAPHETRDDRGRRRAFSSPEATAEFPE